MLDGDVLRPHYNRLWRFPLHACETNPVGVTEHGRIIPHVTLPARLRLSRTFVFRKRWRLTVIGEAFNLYNTANLSGDSNVSPPPLSAS